MEDKMRDIQVKYKEEKDLDITINDKNKHPVLRFFARIEYGHEAGGAPLLQIIVNDVLLTMAHLMKNDNKGITKNGKEFYWNNPNIKGWILRYSPDFKTNYFHPRYQIINSDPYLFIFNLSEINRRKTKNGNGFEVIFKHRGLEGHEAYESDLIIERIEII